MKFMLKHAWVSIFLFSTLSYAGGTQGGGGPPAKEMLEQLMLARVDPSAGLFTTSDNELALGINRELTSDFTLTKANSGNGLNVSESDFNLLRSARTIEATPVGKAPAGVGKSYRIEDGAVEGQLVLKDRRLLMRDSVKAE